MSELLKNIDARTKLAGTNKLEILLFFLGVDQRTGRRETFGINVFKVREVMRTPVITAAPDMPSSVEGMVSLRGALVPVIDLAKYSGISPETPREIMPLGPTGIVDNGFDRSRSCRGIGTLARGGCAKRHPGQTRHGRRHRIGRQGQSKGQETAHLGCRLACKLG